MSREISEQGEIKIGLGRIGDSDLSYHDCDQGLPRRKRSDWNERSRGGQWHWRWQGVQRRLHSVEEGREDGLIERVECKGKLRRWILRLD